MTDELRYPTGKYIPQPYSAEQKAEWLISLKQLPEELEHAILNLDEAQLQTPYREGGWTVHQLIHHVADSHMNAYLRMKLALTENKPEIKTYQEKEWVKLRDVQILPVNISVTLLHALHLRWVAAIENLPNEDWEKNIYHPEHKKEITLWFLLGMYAWHCKHHVRHITALRERMGW